MLGRAHEAVSDNKLRFPISSWRTKMLCDEMPGTGETMDFAETQ